MNGKMGKIKERIDEIKREKEEYREKYDYLVEQLKKKTDSNAREIESVKKDMGKTSGEEKTGEARIRKLEDSVSSLRGSLAESDRKYAALKDRMEEKSGESKEADTDAETEIKDMRKSLASLSKSLSSLSNRQERLEERIKGKVEAEETALDSEIRKRLDDIRGELLGNLKDDIGKSAEEVKNLGKEVKKLSLKGDKQDDRIAGMRSLINGLDKGLKEIQGRHSLMKEKLAEDVQVMAEEIKAESKERIKSAAASIEEKLGGSVKKNLEEAEKADRMVKDLSAKMREGLAETEKLKKRLEPLEGRLSEIDKEFSSLKSDTASKIKLLEKDVNTEMSKARGMEERLEKEIDDFGKAAQARGAEAERFKSEVSDKLDMFSVEKKNIEKDFAKLYSEFKDTASRIDSLKEKDSDFSQRIQNLELETDNTKKTVDETINDLTEDQRMFKENLVAKLNEASEKITNRLSKSEIKTESEIREQAEEIKAFRSHVTQFINDFISNYEKRFGMMKDELDKTLKLLSEREKEQRAMIFE